MGKSIAVTPERLEAAAAKIESMAADYKTQYQSLYSQTDDFKPLTKEKVHKSITIKLKTSSQSWKK